MNNLGDWVFNDWAVYAVLLLLPVAVTGLSWWRWTAAVKRSEGKVGPVGHIHGMHLLFGVLLPSVLAWLGYLLLGAMLLWQHWA